jgi:hypothetical protein
MADTLEAFYGHLGALADPVNQLADASCGCALGLAPGEATVDATLAVSKVLGQYAALSAQGETLRQMLVAGAKIPCDVWLAYANARQDYITKSQYVFDQLAAKGVTIEQVVYSGGKPKPDPSDPSKVMSLQVQAPLRPPAFVGIDQQCPGVPVMSGANFRGALGWERTPYQLGSVSSSLLMTLGTAAGTGVLMLMSAGMPIGLATYGSYKVMKTIAVVLQDYDASPSRILAAYTGCFQAAVKAGVSAVEAAKQCSAVQTAAEKSREAVAKAQASGGLGFWGWLGVGTAVVILGSIVFRFVRGRVSLATRVARAAVADGALGRATGKPREQWASRPGDPILLGDLYYQPRGRRRGR